MNAVEQLLMLLMLARALFELFQRFAVILHQPFAHGVIVGVGMDVVQIENAQRTQSEPLNHRNELKSIARHIFILHTDNIGEHPAVRADCQYGSRFMIFRDGITAFLKKTQREFFAQIRKWAGDLLQIRRLGRKRGQH